MTAERVRADSHAHLSPSVFVFHVAALAVFTPWAHPVAGAPDSKLEPVVEVHATRRMAAPALAVSEMAGNLRDAGLPVSAIAEAARVERKTVYSWLDGAAARESHASRMGQIHRALLPDGRRDLRDLYRMWATPLADGTTLKSLLAAEALDAAAVRSALATLLPRAGALAGRRRRMAVPDGANGFAEGLEVATAL